MINLNELNPEQQKAAKTINGPVLILAGAGSGKTKTVTYRIGNMLLNHGISPENILALSFTNKAAEEMRERVKNLVSAQKVRKLTLSTFHALGVTILREDIHHLGIHSHFTIYDASDQLSLIREALAHYNNNDKQFDRKVIQQKISFLKNKGIYPDQFPHTKHFDFSNAYDLATEHVYQYYQNKLFLYNALDFDDLLLLTVKLFEDHPAIREKYSKRFRYIMVDEYQDTNPLQFKFLKFLTSTHHNICVVGDDDQSIYAFRGATVENILSFEHEYPNTTVIKLEQNFRSTSPILDLANHVIKENPKRKSKKLWTKIGSIHKPTMWVCGDAEHETLIIAEEIKNYRQKGYSYSDMALIYRSNHQAPPFEEVIRAEGIPYRIVGGQKFFEKKEIKDLIAYLSLINNPFDEISLRRIINTPARGIGEETLKKFLSLSKEKKEGLWKTMTQNPSFVEKRTANITGFIQFIFSKQKEFKEKPLSMALKSLVDDLNFETYIEDSYDKFPKQKEKKLNELRMFLASTERFQKIFGKDATLRNFLEKVLLDDREKEKDENEFPDEVTLMTMHSSKGLEYKVVFLVGMEEDLLPHKRGLEDDHGVEEERRLLYVGITRAKERLFLTRCKKRNLFGKDSPKNTTRFLKMIPENLLEEQDRTTFGHMSETEVTDYKKNFFNSLIDKIQTK